MEKIIYELLTRFTEVLSEQSDAITDLLDDPDFIDILDEAKEIVIDESLKIVDEYIDSISTEDD